MNAEQARKQYEKAFMDGVEATQKNMVKSIYAAAALAAHRRYHFGKDRCATLLCDMDNIICGEFTSLDMIDKVYKEIGLVIDFHDGIEPVKVAGK